MSEPLAVRAGRQISWDKPLIWLPSPLLESNRLWKSVAFAWLLAFPGSLLLAALVHWIVPNAKVPDFGQVSALYAAFLVIVVSPIVETLIMGGVLLLLLRFLRPTYAVVTSAMAWGIAHSLLIPTWGLIVWWPFLIFSTLFVVWRSRSLWFAFGIPMAAHALYNLLPPLLVAFG